LFKTYKKPEEQVIIIHNFLFMDSVSIHALVDVILHRVIYTKLHTDLLVKSTLELNCTALIFTNLIQLLGNPPHSHWGSTPGPHKETSAPKPSTYIPICALLSPSLFLPSNATGISITNNKNNHSKTSKINT